MQTSLVFQGSKSYGVHGSIQTEREERGECCAARLLEKEQISGHQSRKRRPSKPNRRSLWCFCFPRMRSILIGVVVAICAVAIVVFVIMKTRPVSRHNMVGSDEESNSSTKPLVLVVGSGLAGLCAAVELSQAGNRVVVAEQSHAIGGNSVRAKSGVSRPPADTTQERDLMLADLLRHAGHDDSKGRARDLVDGADAAHDWVRTVLGVPLPVLSRTGGHSKARTYRTAPEHGPVGAALVNAAASAARRAGALICLGRRLEALSPPLGDDCIQAVFVSSDTGERVVQRANVVILATGGYANPRGPLVPPALRHLPTTNADTSIWGARTLLMLRDSMGLPLVDVDQLQVHPTALVDPTCPNAPGKELVGEALRGSECGGVLLNGRGERFVDEMKGRKEVVDAMDRVGGPFYLRVPRTGSNNNGIGTAASPCADLLRSYEERGMAVHTDDNAVTLRVTPALHYAMGGLDVDADCHVLDAHGLPVPRLLAAGECTGGLHGANRLAGNSLLECIVYGRRAAWTAAEELRMHRPAATNVASSCSIVLCKPCSPSPEAAARKIDRAELARHASASDAWVAFHGTVYDVTKYVQAQPSSPSVATPRLRSRPSTPDNTDGIY
jgi:FAD-dependent fumarate reductase